MPVRNGNGDLVGRSTIQLRGSPGTGAGSARAALKLGLQQAALSESLQMKSHGTARQVERSCCLIPTHRGGAERDEVKQGPAYWVAEGRYGGDSVLLRLVIHIADRISKTKYLDKRNGMLLLSNYEDHQHCQREEIMIDSESFVIVGAGLAGASAARTLREEHFAGRIRLIGAEAHRPYIRPPLSKDYLSGSADRDSVFVDPEGWYAENAVELLQNTTVTGIDAAGQVVHTDTGDAVSFNKLLLTTGSSPRRLSIPGADLYGVHYLRTLDDSDALRSLLAGGGMRLVLIGSGWIGMEVAATARSLGNNVTILERDPIPLANALGDELGQMFAELHEQNGVVLRRSVIVESIVGRDGHATGVALEGGEVISADLVLVGVGAIPNIELADAAGLTVDNGILVDAALRTSDPSIFAAGDIANAYHPVAKLRLRSEHWANALNGGRAAAKSMLGHDVSYDDIPYFYTDQFDLGMEYSGFGPLTRGADVVYRGDRAGREFIAFWVAGGRVVAGMNVNVWDVNEAVQGIIRRGNQVDRVRLADATVSLETL